MSTSLNQIQKSANAADVAHDELLDSKDYWEQVKNACTSAGWMKEAAQAGVAISLIDQAIELGFCRGPATRKTFRKMTREVIEQLDKAAAEGLEMANLPIILPSKKAVAAMQLAINAVNRRKKAKQGAAMQQAFEKAEK